jgi:hypothetical protein
LAFGVPPRLSAGAQAEIAFAAVRRGRDDCVPGAAEALAELDARGGQSPIARAILRRLAEEVDGRMQKRWNLEDTARAHRPLAPPELN